MTFENLHRDVPKNCSCTDNGVVDVENIFVRCLNKIPTSDLDLHNFFKSKWEKCREDDLYPDKLDIKDCDSICGSKGVSIHIWNNEEQQKKALDKIEKDFQISRKPKKCLLVFKLYSNAGLVKQKGFETHYNFFKSDDFLVNSLQQIEILNSKNLFLEI
jgi:hypothetical protein